MNISEIKHVMEHAKAVHLIGVGGVSMSSLAEILMQMGYAVSGSDKTKSAVTERLSSSGIRVRIGHDAAHILGSDVIVYTAAVPRENPELRAAREAGMPILTRGELLGWLMLGYERRIGVAGTHGKSTTTSMLAVILMGAQVDPTVISGANLAEMGGAYRIGGKSYFLFEACEYKDSFLSFYPTTAVIGNVELDHTDYFPNLARMEESFRTYLSIAQIGILNADDPAVARVAEGFAGRAVTFGLGENADYRAENIKLDGLFTEFDLIHHARMLGRIHLRVPGMHNVCNALSAAAAAMENGIDFEAVKEGLARFGGAGRRFDYCGMLGGAPVYNDYAHHPTEIRATLTAAKTMGKRVVCVFQPHTFARTHELFDGFAQALSLADRLYLADIYAAREENLWGVSSKQLADAIPGARCPGDFSAIAEQLRREVGEGDLLLIMGAGDIISLASLLPLKAMCEP